MQLRIQANLHTGSLFCVFIYVSEYDGQLAPGGASESGMASSSYLETNLNHSSAGGCGVKSRSGMPGGPSTSGSAGGLERPPGSMDRVLKIFHYFETNSEPCTWASNIRHGDATDVRVKSADISYMCSSVLLLCDSHFSSLFIQPFVSTGCNPEDSRDPQTALCGLFGSPSDPFALGRSPLVTP